MARGLVAIAAAVMVLVGLARPAAAQQIGTFRWQLAPFCNVVTLSITQDGAIYAIDGYDDQCGAATRAAVAGVAFPNPNGTIGMGFGIVTSPAGAPVHVEAALTLPALSGAWSDSAGHTGTFVFMPAGAATGSPRPAPPSGIPDGSITAAKLAAGSVDATKIADGSIATAKLADDAVDGTKIADGSIGAHDIDPGQVQRRIISQCAPGQLMIGIRQNGTVICEAVSSSAGGDISSVFAGAGLTGGGTTGDLAMFVDFAQVQARIAAACPAGQFVRAVNQDGTMLCEAAGAAAAMTAGGDQRDRIERLAAEVAALTAQVDQLMREARRR